MKMFVDVSDIYLHRDPVDFRKAINGLVLIVEQQMQLSPFSETLFVFCNKSRDKLKVLYWDKTGFACGINAWSRISSNGPVRTRPIL